MRNLHYGFLKSTGGGNQQGGSELMSFLKARVEAILPQGSIRIYRSARQSIRRTALSLRPYSTLSPIERYYRDGHDDLITQNLGLNAASVVLDFGGYVGNYTATISDRYQSQIHVFEPVPEFSTILQARFKNEANITLHEYGIAEVDDVRTFGVSADGTGAFAEGAGVSVSFRSADYLAEAMPPLIDLMAVNIEGGEYELIPALDHVGLLARTNRIFVQFHRVGPDPHRDRASCRRLLKASHTCIWSYDFVWEAWVRKTSADPSSSI